MKSMRKILFLICLFSLSFYSCAIRDYLAPKDNLDAERTFVAQMINDGKSAGYFNISSQLIKTTDKLAVYLQNGGNISLYGLNKMAQDFDYYYDDMTNIYGEHSDIDANGKIIIVLMDINVKKGGPTTLAYFNPNDMHGNNKGEILYMDLSNANYNIDKSIGTLIHEFQHLINYSYVVSGKRDTMSSWLNEALSESTSILFNKTTAESRMREFITNTMNYYCFYTWDLPTSYGFVNYPSASVFMNWLYVKSGSNSNIFREIAQSRENTDYNKVLTAAKGISGLSVSSWEDLLLTWMECIVTNCETKWVGDVAPKHNTTSGTKTLYPGAMVVYNNNFSGSTNPNIVARTNGNNIIVLNKDTTLGKTVSVKTETVIGSSSVDLAARSRKRVNIAEKKEETQIINILLDENGNIQKY